VDNRVILAVAGSGKTSYIIDSLRSSGRSVVVTYTNNNLKNLHNRIAGEYECIPDRIRLYEYFSFLYSFCLRPYLHDQLKIRGINWDVPPEYTRIFIKTDERRYLDTGKRLYHSRMAGLLSAKDLVPDVKRRLSKYFDSFFVDEVQDFAGHDFNFMCDIASADVCSMLVGDFYQHTYDTSRDGSVNKNLHKDMATYISKLKDQGYDIDDTLLSKSYRCSPTVCDFVSKNIGIDIMSHRNDETRVEYVDSETRADELFSQSDIVKLFYQSHDKYPCFSDNWGASKGIDSYGSVCVVLNNKTDDHYRTGRLNSLASMTKNKLYVACTRSKADLYFVPEHFYRKYKT
jgi:DNA helicase II / ATP-dependent DNA helicase PcrA